MLSRHRRFGFFKLPRFPFVEAGPTRRDLPPVDLTEAVRVDFVSSCCFPLIAIAPLSVPFLLPRFLLELFFSFGFPPSFRLSQKRCVSLLPHSLQRRAHSRPESFSAHRLLKDGLRIIRFMGSLRTNEIVVALLLRSTFEVIISPTH